MVSARTLLVLAGVAAILWSRARWRQAVQVGMVLLILEGAIRKWVFPGAQDLVYFAKDVFFLGAYLGWFQERPRLARLRVPALPMLFMALGLAAAYGLLQVFNPRLPNFLVGILGFKAYFFYVPLLFVVPAAFRTEGELVRFLRRYVLLAIPLGLLAAAQFVSPGSSALNTYARTNAETFYATTFGSSTHVRVTATFSYITGYTSYLLATAILILALLGASRWRVKSNLFIFGALAAILLGMLMSGSRGPILMLALLMPIYLWLVLLRGGGGAVVGRLLLAMTLVGAFVSYTGGEAVDAFYGRAIGGTDVPGRMVSPFLQPKVLLPDAGLFGFGIGATHQTAAAVTPGVIPYSWTRGIVVEGETGRVMLELGAFGFVLVYFIRLYLPLFAFGRVLALRRPLDRAVATACVLFFLAQVPGGVVFEFVNGVYYWFFGGLLMLVMRFDREAAAATVAAAAARRRAMAEPVPELAAAAGAPAGPRGIA